MYNKIILVGNLTKDIELRYLPSGTAIANTSIATSHKYTSNGEKKEETCFIDLSFFGRSAEVANQYLKKGSKILVEGRLKHDTWTDNEGNKKSKHSVLVETMQMLGTKQESQKPEVVYENPQGPTYQPHKQNHTAYKNTPPPQKEAGTLDMDGEEIPF